MALQWRSVFVVLLLIYMIPIETQAFSVQPTSTVIHKIDDISCREIQVYISNIDQSITLLEATLEGQEKLVDEVLLLDDEVDVESDIKVVNDDPYGSVLWPAASTLSEHITSDSFYQKKRDENDEKPSLLELGTGTGLVALAASVSNKYSTIHATDYETVPLKLLDASQKLNSNQNHCKTPINTSLFDICDLSIPLPAADIVCAADILYEKKTGIALATRTIEALARGSRVVIGCSPGRPGRPAFIEELQRLSSKDVNFVNIEGSTCTGERNSLICGEGSTSISKEPQALQVALLDLTPDCIESQ